MRLHHRVALVGCGVSCVELDRRRRERAGKIADGGIWRAAEPGFGLHRGVPRRREIEAALRGSIANADELCGSTSLLERLRDDDGNRLVIALDLRPAKQLGGGAIVLAERAGT